MAIPEPKNFMAALSLTNYFNWFIGMGLFRQPNSTRLRIAMSLYSIGTWVAFVSAYYFGGVALSYSTTYHGSHMALVMFQVLVVTNAIVSLMIPFITWLRLKGFNDFIDRTEKLDNTCARLLGFKEDYKKLVVSQITNILTICLILATVTIIDTQVFQDGLPLVTRIATTMTLHHPMLIMLVSDFTFCGSIRIIERRFENVNKALHGLTVLDFASYPFNRRLVVTEYKPAIVYSVNRIVNDEAKKWTSKRDLFQTIRKSHLELSKLAARLNSVFGLQILMSMGVSLVMTTGLLYTIYSAFSWKHKSLDLLTEALPPACWCLIYSFKIVMVSYRCARITDEAKKSGQIIYEILGSVTDREFQREIQEFALQMIQNPVRFTAYGFVTLDLTYVQGVIGSITTYLVILIQMSTPSLTRTPTANATDT